MIFSEILTIPVNHFYFTTPIKKYQNKNLWSDIKNCKFVLRLQKNAHQKHMTYIYIYVFDLYFQYIDLEKRNLTYLTPSAFDCGCKKSSENCVWQFRYSKPVASLPISPVSTASGLSLSLSNPYYHNQQQYMTEPGYHFPSLHSTTCYEYPSAYYSSLYQSMVIQYPSYSMTYDVTTQNYFGHFHHFYQTMDYSPYTTYPSSLSQYQHQ